MVDVVVVVFVLQKAPLEAVAGELVSRA